MSKSSKPLEYAVLPLALLQNPPITSGELSVFELKVALHLVAMTYLQNTVDLNAQADQAAQRAIDQVKLRTQDGTVVRRAARKARREFALQDYTPPDEVEICITAREMLRTMGLAATAPTARLRSAWKRLLRRVRLPNSALRFPPLLSSVRQDGSYFVLTINRAKAWFPDDQTARRKVAFPLPSAARGEATNIVALYLLSHTWRTTGHRRGTTRQALIDRLGVARWRAVERALRGLNQHLKNLGDAWMWRMAVEQEAVKFKQVPSQKRRRLDAVCSEVSRLEPELALPPEMQDHLISVLTEVFHERHNRKTPMRRERIRA